MALFFISGLLFHKVITYFAKLRSRRRQYQKGLKQLGEHMHAVTRQMSSNPTPVGTPVGTPVSTPLGTPAIAMRKLAAINSNSKRNASNGKSNGAKIPDDDNSVFKPSTHVMRREDSDLGVMTSSIESQHKQEKEELLYDEKLRSREETKTFFFTESKTF